MKIYVGVLLGAMFSIVIHLTLGWAWTALAAVAVGLVMPRWGWLAGALVVALGWGALIAYSFVVAPRETIAMLEIFASLVGNLPGVATVALSLLIAGTIGALGGLLGSLLVRLKNALPSGSDRRVHA
jgi:hypothetical protein